MSETIKMYQFPPVYGLSSASPFCTKLEAFLRMADLPFELGESDPRKAPRGKTPYVKIDGALMGDSQLIIEHLIASRGLDIDAWLTPAQHALGHTVRRMCEEHTYWGLVYARWIDEAGWVHQQKYLKKILPLPGPLLAIVPGVLRRNLGKTMKAHGLGRHDQETIYAFMVKDIEALAGLLGEQEYLLGAQWSSYDATFFATLWHGHQTPTDNPGTVAIKAQPNLVAYIERMKARLGFA